MTHAQKLRYTKRPVTIEAFQMTKERRADNSDWPFWLRMAWNKPFTEAGAVSCADWPHSNGTDQLVIRTLEGVMYVGWGDYIIQGVKGELYACKPDIFEATYLPELEALKAREPMTDEQRGTFIIEHFGPHALAGDRMSIFDAVNKTIDELEARHNITNPKETNT